MSIFCYQCEEAAGGKGCQNMGRCGKTQKVGSLQNLLLAWCRHIATSAVQMRTVGSSSEVIDTFLLNAIYSTLTNVNFDEQDLAKQIFLADRIRQVAEHLGSVENLPFQASLEEQASEPVAEPDQAQIDELARQGEEYSVQARQQAQGETVAGLQELLMAGIKGTVAYAWHVHSLQHRYCASLRNEIIALDHEIKAIKVRDAKDRTKKNDLTQKRDQIETSLNDMETKYRELLDGLWAQMAFLANDPKDAGQLTEAALTTGKLNLIAMELLEKSHIQLFGVQEPSVVRLSQQAGKCILVSGHDLEVLRELLEQTAGQQVNVYTHGELLTAHAYPELKRFPHLVGHYGGAWHLQKKEFGAFPGAILMTSNCLQEPEESYRDYIFSTGPVHSSRVKRIQRNERGKLDFSPLIKAALDSPGYFKSKAGEKLTIGFGADAMIRNFELLKKSIDQGYLERFFLIGGCDGHDDDRNYFTQLASLVPADCVILTLGCGKYRFNRENMPSLKNGFSRLIDMGQCNDAWGAIRLVQFLTEQLQCKINQLPLSIILSWYEQKAVAVLLSLLALGVQGIRLGPTLPAFLTESSLAVLVDRFKLKPVTDPQLDIKEMYQG